MGYYTRFTFSLPQEFNNQIDTSCITGAIVQDFRESCWVARCAFNEKGNPLESCKWYEYPEDLIQFSKKHPNLVMMLHGDGEDDGDAWNFYAKDGHGKMCRGQIVYPQPKTLTI